MVDMSIKQIPFNDACYPVVRLLGKGKGGYSYLAEAEGRLAVVKHLHHEPCDYYAFGATSTTSATSICPSGALTVGARDTGRIRPC